MSIFFISFGALFTLTNPLGTLPIFIGLTTDKSKKQISSIALWTSINVAIILIISFLLGNYLLDFFGISLNSLKIAGGMIIASSGFALLTGNFTKHKGMKQREKDDAFNRSEVTLTPLALPMLAGPGSMSLLITYNQEQTNLADKLPVLLSIALVAVTIFIILASSRVINKSLGASGITALSRIVGFIVISIGVEFIVTAISDIVMQLK